MNKKLRGNLLLLLTALIWGTSFVAQRAGMDYIEPFTFNGIRSLIGGIVLIPVIFFLGKMNLSQRFILSSYPYSVFLSARKFAPSFGSASFFHWLDCICCA